MKLLIIYTYPNHSSLNYAFLQKVIKGSKENSNIKEVQILDLYEEGFDPLLVFNEQKRRRDMHADLPYLVGKTTCHAFGVYRSIICFEFCL